MRDKQDKLITIRKMADSKFRFNSLLYGTGGVISTLTTSMGTGGNNVPMIMLIKNPDGTTTYI